jgi:hypothetical protein
MRILTILATFVVCFATHAASADPKGGRTCRIVFPERPKDSPRFAFIYDGKETQRVNLPTTNFSEVIALPSGEITILMTAEEITDFENLPLSAPRLAIAEGIRDFYILISPDPSNPILPIKMNMVNPEGKFKPGETLWFNLTEHKIAGKLGDSTLLVAPKSSTVSKSPISESGYYRAEFAYQSKAEGRLQKITEQQWWHDANSRHLGFIVNTGGRLPKLYFYRDFRLDGE